MTLRNHAMSDQKAKNPAVIRKPASGRRPRVALWYPAPVLWMQRVQQGVAEESRTLGGWDLVSCIPGFDGARELGVSPAVFRHFRIDGLIALLRTRREIARVRTLGIPFVNFGGELPPIDDLARVMVDHAEVGRQAGAHLLGLGLRHLAYLGQGGTWYQDERRRGFHEVAKRAKVSVHDYPRSSGARRGSWKADWAVLERWVLALPKPAGVFAVYDYRGRLLIEACLRVGVRVPEDIAVVGVDNEPVLCEQGEPALSSIDCDRRGQGRAAARLLDRLMKQRQPLRGDVLIRPTGVVARRSTDLQVINDPLVRDLDQHLRDHLQESLAIADLARDAGVSRRLLELRFRKELGRPPYDHLLALRLARARQMLIAQDPPPLADIASACGFTSLRMLKRALRKGVQ